jgi:hypothetical protein
MGIVVLRNPYLYSRFAGVAVTSASGAEATSAFVFGSNTEILSLPTSIARLGLKWPAIASEYEAPARVENDTSQQRVGCSCIADSSLTLIPEVSRRRAPTDPDFAHTANDRNTTPQSHSPMDPRER